MSITLKLKFKIELSSKLIKPEESKERNKSKSSIRTTDKNSMKQSKIIASNEFDSIPGYETIIAKLTPDDRDELNTCLKLYNQPTLSGVFVILQNKKLYSRLKSKLGLESIKNLYREAVKKLETIYIIDECELFLCLKDYFEMSDLECMDLFDLFKFNEFFAFTEQCFVILVYLLVSHECGYLTDFFQNFGDELFLMLSAEESGINISRLKEVGRLLGVNERMLEAHAKELGFEYMIEKSQFKEYYSTLLKAADEKTQYNTLMSNKKQMSNPGATCYNKTCNIL
jgi:hypothetical protein